MFVEHKAVQGVVQAYVALEPNGSTGSFLWGFSTVGYFRRSNSGSGLIRQAHMGPYSLHTGSLGSSAYPLQQSVEEPSGIIAIHGLIASFTEEHSTCSFVVGPCGKGSALTSS